MKKTLVITFWASFALIVLAIVLLLVFKFLDCTALIAAYSVAVLALIGGVLLIISSVYLSLRKDIASVWAEKLLFHLPEIIPLGLVSIGLSVILFWGKMLR